MYPRPRVIVPAILMVAVLTFLLQLPYVGWALLVLTAVVAIRIPLAWSDCRGNAGLSDHAGGTCPSCGAQNPVKPWSF